MLVNSRQQAAQLHSNFRQYTSGFGDAHSHFREQLLRLSADFSVSRLAIKETRLI